jgi:hypothetical protein
MLFVVKNKNLFILNSEIHTKSTRQFNNFYQPITNHTIYQRAVHYMCIKIFNHLPPYIKDISNNVRKLEICLKHFLHIHPFYSIEEYFNIKLSQVDDVPLNVFNKTIYLIYSLNNLCLLSLSLTKINLNIHHLNVIHICIIAICLYFATVCLLAVSDLFLCL